jgi:hypothetical protein
VLAAVEQIAISGMADLKAFWLLVKAGSCDTASVMKIKNAITRCRVVGMEGATLLACLGQVFFYFLL